MSWRPRSSREFEAFRSELERLQMPSAGGVGRGTAELRVVRRTESTNGLARRALGGEAHRGGLVLVAWEQTGGRGRRGRGWISPAGGGLYASIVVPVSDRAALDSLPLLVPVELCRSLSGLDVDCRLKWPNDLIAGGRKLGGVLIESISSGGAPVAAIVGIGVNYRTPASGELGRSAVGLRELLDPAPALGVVARRLLEPLLVRLAALHGSGPMAVIDDFRALSVHRPGDRLACRTVTETVEGAFLGFDESGLLRLRAAGGERTIASGEIIES